MKTLILGLGNPILGDDSVGLRVAETIKDRVTSEDVVVIGADVSGLSLLDLLVGYDKVVLVDAIQTKGGRVGEVCRLEVENFNATRRTASTHGINLATALELGKKLNLALPRQLTIIAIEIPQVCKFSEECRPEVEGAIPLAVDMVIQALSEE